MGLLAGGLLRGLTTLFYMLAFLCAAFVTGVFAYFIFEQSHHNITIATKWEAVLGMAACAVLFTGFAVILTCFLAGMKTFGILGVIFNLIFMGAFIAIAVLDKQGAKSCGSTVMTPVGSGMGMMHKAGTLLERDCKLNRAVFIVACITAGIFGLLALLQLATMIQSQKSKKNEAFPDSEYASNSYSHETKESTRESKNDYDIPKPENYNSYNERPAVNRDNDVNRVDGGLTTEGTEGYRGTTGPNDTVVNNVKYDTSKYGGYNMESAPAGTSANPHGFSRTMRDGRNLREDRNMRY